ncbi:MAG: two-component system, chemotaxis family, chemotaxis protein CheY [Acidobacteriaceae bacterium]|jgi:two-component system cell cycle response regulator|nr:two-component system, chemotaxis family, chemotaxis protein CheY [Acidobacteriaceae bacterium]
MVRPASIEGELCTNDSAAQELQILIVDDSAVSRKLVEHALEGNSYSLMFAKSGSEALELFARHLPAIVISDWMMPDLSGLDLCLRLRSDVHPGYTYIILLTSIAEKDNVVKGLAAGADDYLTKPFDPGELLARIGVGRRIIDLHRQIDAKNKLLEEMAHSDSLTGLPNRRAIEEWGARQLRAAVRHGFPYWVVLADLDSFKTINDTYGHPGGDAMLQKFADILKTVIRASDICGRLGGDEFLMVITHVEGDALYKTIEGFREKLAAEQFELGFEKVSITASFGIAGLRGKENIDFTTLLRRADKALYEAKRDGRNVIRIEPEQVK